MMMPTRAFQRQGWFRPTRRRSSLPAKDICASRRPSRNPWPPRRSLLTGPIGPAPLLPSRRQTRRQQPCPWPPPFPLQHPARRLPSRYARRRLDAGASTETPASIGGAIEQAELLLRIGNIAGARNVLEPFATAKHPEALAELGKTFDPIELEKFLIAPGSGNAAKAIELYTEAAGRGSLVAKLRLERLNTASVPVEQQR